ncbi:ribonuclease E [Pelagibaculum spongiae]|uniref:Ribonuclease E n=1 Tax=Pelagibaculum spongiae TaxID=2080658 RepID=A0A2V1GTJ5_9GAMM|nr:ribonuclease E [Pelagibaculum spongiae]PVZ68928.1 ribonuclease E [Pelagibaculum spongiae]
MKRMLINATHQEEVRVAMVDGQRLYDLDIDAPGRAQKKANIYKGKVTRIEPSLEAAFVNYGADRHGFLPLKEVAHEYFPSKDFQGRPSIKDALREGQEIIVQIDKEERGSKGAALTTFVSLAGSFIVLMPNNPRAGGISRRIEGEERTQIREARECLNIPDGMGLIVRTAGVGRSAEDLQYDLEILLNLWGEIGKVVAGRSAPFLIHQESDVTIRAIRDYLRIDVGEILVDSQTAYDKARAHISRVRPDYLNKVKMYQDTTPLFSRFQIESQIETAFEREVRLPSGGSVVIDPTEALISIDINSARATKGSDIEETALTTNLEACDEIARQLRLRDIGGLIVIDFIDMGPTRAQREVENRMRDALRMDRARIQVGRISRFGLLEMSRQRLRPSLGESSKIVCPRCSGQGTVRGVESLSLSILRLIEEESMKEKTTQIRAIVPVEVGTYLLNEKRSELAAIEKRKQVSVLVVPNPHMLTPEYEVQRLREDGLIAEDDGPSYSFAEAPELPEISPVMQPENIGRDEPAVNQAALVAPIAKPVMKIPTAVPAAKAGKPGLFSRIWSAIVGEAEEAPAKPAKPANKRNTNDRNDRGNRNKQGRGNNRDRQRNNDRNGDQNNQDQDGQKARRQNNRKQPVAPQDKEQTEAQQQDGRRSRNNRKPRQQNSGQPETNNAPMQQAQPEQEVRENNGRRNNRRRNSKQDDQPQQQDLQSPAVQNNAEVDFEPLQAQEKPERRRNQRRNQQKSDESLQPVEANAVEPEATESAESQQERRENGRRRRRQTRKPQVDGQQQDGQVVEQQTEKPSEITFTVDDEEPAAMPAREPREHRQPRQRRHPRQKASRHPAPELDSSERKEVASESVSVEKKAFNPEQMLHADVPPAMVNKPAQVVNKPRPKPVAKAEVVEAVAKPAEKPVAPKKPAAPASKQVRTRRPQASSEKPAVEAQPAQVSRPAAAPVQVASKPANSAMRQIKTSRSDAPVTQATAAPIAQPASVPAWKKQRQKPVATAAPAAMKQVKTRAENA